MMDLILKRSENIVFRKIGDEYLLVPIAASVADLESIFNLNETGAAIWDLIDGKRNVRDIVSEIEGEYEVERQEVEADVILLIHEMVETKLIEA